MLESARIIHSRVWALAIRELRENFTVSEIELQEKNFRESSHRVEKTMTTGVMKNDWDHGLKAKLNKKGA